MAIVATASTTTNTSLSFANLHGSPLVANLQRSLCFFAFELCFQWIYITIINMKWFKSISLEIFNPFHFPLLQPTFVGITNCLLLHKSKFGCLISFYCIDLCWVSCMAAPNHRLFPLTRKDLWLMNLNVRES